MKQLTTTPPIYNALQANEHNQTVGRKLKK